MRSRAGRVGGALVVLVLSSGLPIGIAWTSGAPAPEAETRRSGEDCGSCHRDVVPGGHPVNVRPRDASVPAGWPLDAYGRITCATCHAACARDGTMAGARGPEATLRGGRSGPAICRACHQGPPAGAGPSPSHHATLVGLAHPAAGGGDGAIDGSSRRCLSCHDGLLAGAGDLALERGPGIGERRNSHPMGVPYPPRPGRAAERNYVPRALLDERIHLPGGRVACVSCHSVYAGEEGLLVMSNRLSALCLACHRK
ncbi:MAG: hypothetical protein HY721_02940 [Planctomycetes bacterium]|nr:hypothetical protein [Planctomycetota bacterium]